MSKPPGKSRRLLKNFSEIIREILLSRAPDDLRPVMIMAQDESCFGRISEPKRAWSPPRMRPQAPRQIIREYVYVYTAVCPALGKTTSLILPYADTEMMNIFLKHVSETFPEYFIIMLADQAGWHTSRHLALPENINLLLLPAHSPELNPVEHIWDELREKNFHNRDFDSLDGVEENLCAGLNNLTNDSEKVRSLTNFPYLNITY